MPNQPATEVPRPPPTPPRRARFQIHLSTAIVLMFVAGGLIWANTNRGRAENHNYGHFATVYPRGSDEYTTHEIVVHAYGWPFNALEKFAYIVDEYDGKPSANPRLVDPNNEKSHLETGETRWNILALIGDISFAIAILATVRFVCEWRIRRSARKGA
ncbi:MAG TPA: hypothetical protein VKX17_11540 [Planctomycetota bacterium]|nr:hypothetical protein [Planctomycetota bacterium]